MGLIQDPQDPLGSPAHVAEHQLVNERYVRVCLCLRDIGLCFVFLCVYVLVSGVYFLGFGFLLQKDLELALGISRSAVNPQPEVQKTFLPLRFPLVLVFLFCSQRSWNWTLGLVDELYIPLPKVWKINVLATSLEELHLSLVLVLGRAWKLSNWFYGSGSSKQYCHNSLFDQDFPRNICVCS